LWIKYFLCLLSRHSVSVVPHDSESKECWRKIAEANTLNQKLNGVVSEEDLKNLRRELEDHPEQQAKIKRIRQKPVG
jgi:cryptochrome